HRGEPQLRRREEPCRRRHDQCDAHGPHIRGADCGRAGVRPRIAFGRLRNSTIPHPQTVDRALVPLAGTGTNGSLGHQLRFVVAGRRRTVTGEQTPYGYRAELPPARFNMAAYVIGRAAAVSPDKPALIVISDPLQPPAEIWTFAALEDAILRVAAALKAAGLEPGERSMIRLDNTSTYALLFFGAIAGGYVPLPTSSQLTPGEAAFLLQDSGAAAVALADRLPIIDIPAGVRVLESGRVQQMTTYPARATYTDTAADDPAYLIYTSGTTSRPKGVLHGHRAAWGRRPMYQGWYGIRPSDRILHAGAFNWTYTLGTGLTDPWANGATAIIYTGPKDPSVWPRLIRSAEATIFAAVPTLFRQILRYAEVDRG